MSRGQVRVGDGSPVPGEVEVTEAELAIVPEGGAPLHIALVDIEDVHDDDYTLRLTDHTGARYELSMLGSAYGQVQADLRKRRDAALERDLLLRGVNLRDTYPGKLFDADGPHPVELRLYEDLLVVVPERGTMFGVPFSFVDAVEWDPELYQTHVVTDDGRRLVFGHLAKRSEEFRDELRRLLEELSGRTAATLAGLLPDTGPEPLSRLAERMRDGRAAQERVIAEIDPSAWPRLEEAAARTEDLRASYQRLKAMAPPGWTAFGVKAVRSEGSGDEAADLWYFCPLSREGRPANAVAQEVASASGHATYLFRLMEPARFAALDGRALAKEVVRGIARLNRALLLLNFRREPIYLPEEQIASGPHARYRVGPAEARLPALRAGGLPGPGHPQRGLGGSGRGGAVPGVIRPGHRRCRRARLGADRLPAGRGG
ncbi:MAG: hypothetical protein ACRDI0_08555 [Actinomycetota bacterium]